MLNYLIVLDFSGQPAPFLFPQKVAHEDMAGQLPYGKLLSCGNVVWTENGPLCSGGNAELRLKARPEEDAALIKAALA